ncbi:hypothetical protein [Stenotrophomonas phage RAS14]
MNTIFVQMAAYRDPQLVPTLLDMMKNAAHPELLHVGICWQHGEDEPTDIFLDNGFTITGFTEVDSRLVDAKTEVTGENGEKTLVVGAPTFTMEHTSGAKFTVIDLHFHKTKGACWARNAIQQLYTQEKYTLQLDSHHRFVENWDTVSIEMLEGLRSEDCPKPLLTAYIPSFDPENDPGARVMEPWKMDFDRFIPEGAVFFIPSTIDDWREREAPMRARFFSAHFAFADGIFAVEVQHDPQYFFHGEEISIAVRAYTHGYDLFYPHRLIAWHEYTRKGRIKVWDDMDTPNRLKGRVELDWVQRNDLCHKRNRILFGMDGEDPNQIDFGKYGFGDKRTLKDYEQYSGLSFKYRGVTQEVVDRIEPPGNIPYESDEQWKEQIVRSNDVRILINMKEDVKWEDGTIPDDMDFWYVGAAREDLSEIFRKDTQEHEIAQYRNGEWADFRLIWRGNEKPKYYVVWPHSKSRGWRHERIVREIHEH